MSNIHFINWQAAIIAINDFSKEKIPFLVIINFKGNQCVVKPLADIDENQIKYWINSKSNQAPIPTFAKLPTAIDIRKFPINFENYQKGFDLVKNNLLIGNTFLTNYTCETSIKINLKLEDIFRYSMARYKIWLQPTEMSNEFICFSPESFVKINNKGVISSFPMKGTIDANLPNAEQKLLADTKELHEHTTIVDLIRNDISKVANKVWVEKFRYLERIKKQDGRELLQMSSEIKGQLPDNWQENLGTILFDLLPAGSISGAPKEQTISIINRAEKKTYPKSKNRGFYTGICGIFDGETFDSGVMIRFIEQTPKGSVYKSGGGITAKSIAKNEYDEMIQKIYVPIIRNN